jgi:hypothetical protein
MSSRSRGAMRPKLARNFAPLQSEGARTASKNIENNPMQRKEPLENKGVAGKDILAAKNTLTRRANHRHIFTIAPIVAPPIALPVGLSVRSQTKNSDQNCDGDSALDRCSYSVPATEIAVSHLRGAVQHWTVIHLASQVYRASGILRTHRNPRWLVELSIASACRAAGR